MANRMKVVIEQPSYLSWIGYYGMLDVADTFVFYDDVQFVKQSWQQRNRIKVADGEWMWLSVPVFQNFGQKINEVEINNKVNWRKKHWESIYQCYHKTLHFHKYEDGIKGVYEKDWRYLADLDMEIIEKASEMIGIRMPKIMKSSEIGGLTGSKNERLLQLLEKLGADEYVSGIGTKVYIDPQKFKDRNVKLYWYEYKPIAYPQIRGEFLPYMSILDLLFNTGDEALHYIREGVSLNEN